MNRVIALLLIALFATSCDDDDGNNNSNNNNTVISQTGSTVVFTPGQYTPTTMRFTTQVTVTLLDEAGNPVPGKAVLPATDLADSTFDPEMAVSDDQGVAIFTMSTVHMGMASISAQVSLDDQTPGEGAITLDATGTVDFEFSVDVIPLEVTYSPDSAEFSLRATLEDGVGVIGAGELTVQDASGLITFPESELTTDGNGRVVFTAQTPVAGTASLIFSLAGIIETIAVPFNFAGQSIAGQIANTQYYHPLGFHSARVSLMALNTLADGSIDLDHPVKAEIVSETTCPCPGPAEYVLELPITPPEGTLTLDATNNISRGLFAVVVYDDLNEDYAMQQSEPYIGAKLQGTLLHYAADAGGTTFEHLGWSLVNSTLPDAAFLDWENDSEFVDVEITRSPLYEPTFEGNVMAPAADLRVMWAAIDVTAIPGGWTPMEPLLLSQLSLLQDTNNFHVLGDFSASQSTWTGPLPDLNTELDQGTLNAWKFAFEPGLGLGDVEAVLVVGVLYHDLDGSLAFSSGDTVSSLAHEDPAESSVTCYVLNYPNNAMFVDSENYWFHSGYNHLRTARRVTISQVAEAGGVYTITLEQGIGQTDMTGTFSVVEAGQSFGTTPIASGSFTTDSALHEVLTVDSTSCTGCAGVAPGDQFIITTNSGLTPPSYTFADVQFFHFVD